jgi:hypothetical protein
VVPILLHLGDDLHDRLVGLAEVHRVAELAERRLVEERPGAGDRIRDRLGRLLGREHLVLDDADHQHLGLGLDLDLDLGQVRRDVVGRHRVVAPGDVVGVRPVAS